MQDEVQNFIVNIVENTIDNFSELMIKYQGSNKDFPFDYSPKEFIALVVSNILINFINAGINKKANIDYVKRQTDEILNLICKNTRASIRLLRSDVKSKQTQH